MKIESCVGALMQLRKQILDSIDLINSKRVYNLALKKLLEDYPSNNGKAIASYWEVELEEPPKECDDTLYCKRLDNEIEKLNSESIELENQVEELEDVEFTHVVVGAEKVLALAFNEIDLFYWDYSYYLNKAKEKLGDDVGLKELADYYLGQKLDECGIDYFLEDEEDPIEVEND